MLLGGHLQQVDAVTERGVELVDEPDDLGQSGTLAVQLLGTIGVVPDLGLLQLALDLGQPLRLAGVVKDTPSGRRRDLAAVRCGGAAR